LFARPLEWRGEGALPRILYLPRQTDPALGRGDRFLGRLIEVAGEDHSHEARLIRRITAHANRITGIFRRETQGGRIMPIDKGQDKEWRVRDDATLGAEDGELVQAEQAGPRARLGMPIARIIERLGDPSAPRAVSLIAIHQHGIPDEFPEKVLTEAEAAQPAPLKGRDDLRDLPLVTIDPSDARDHDDAVAAHIEEDGGAT
ncbi:MAG: ribonuclease R, partial [Pararhodobacter sp.]